MNFLDIIWIVLIAISFLTGYISGFFYKIGNLIGLILGVIIAGSIYDDIGRIFGGSKWVEIIAFVVIYLLISKLVAIVFKIINKFFKIIEKIPFLKQFNRLLGGIVSVLITVLVISFFAYFFTKFELATGMSTYIDGSFLTKAFIWIGSIFAFLLPNAVVKMKSYI